MEGTARFHGLQQGSAAFIAGQLAGELLLRSHASGHVGNHLEVLRDVVTNGDFHHIVIHPDAPFRLGYPHVVYTFSTETVKLSDKIRSV